jgi:TolA-binding protein
VFGSTAKNRQAEIDREMLVEQTPVAAFRAGWEALRAARYADAIAAFDRATDPAVAEDAMFWAAISAQRAGQADDARKRLDVFLATFPESPRAESARRAREVLR